MKHQISGYRVSRDYEWLADEMQKRSVACVVDYGSDCRDVAQTAWDPTAWRVWVRGSCYIWAQSREEFISDCRKLNVEALMAESEKPCEWTYLEDDDRWLASCGTQWHFEDGMPAEYGVKFCCGCGKPMVELTPPCVINGAIVFENPELPDPL